MGVYQTVRPNEVANRAVYLAWKASQVLGMGILQDSGDLPEDEVLEHVGRGADNASPTKINSIYCDYVFGRMMKLSLYIRPDHILYGDGKISGDYQSWCWKYPTYESLLSAAEKSLD